MQVSRGSKNPNIKWELLKAEGNEHYKKSRWADAMKCYTDAIQVNPEVAVLYSNRALCELRLQKFDQACNDAKNAIAIDPNQIKFYRTLSEALWNLQLYKEAIDACKDGLQIDPKDSTLISRMIDCLAFEFENEFKENSVSAGYNIDMKTPDLSSFLPEHIIHQLSDISPSDIGVMDGAKFQAVSEICKAHRILRAGRGTVRGEQKALKMFESAAQHGSAEGLYNLAIMHLDGMAGLAKNPKQCLHLCRQAAKQKPYLKFEAAGVVLRNVGVSEAENVIAMAYRDGLVYDRDDKLAYQWFLKAAEHGCPLAMNNLGLALYNGAGCEKDLQSARLWYQKSADLGQSEALSNLAEMLVKGEGGPENASKAAELLKAAVDKGLPGALLTLQKLQRSGVFGAQSLNASKSVVQQMADSNEKQALFVVGMNYVRGEGGFAIDLAAAEKYLRKASDLNHMEATFELGNLLLQQKKNEDAVNIIWKAADYGNQEAQWILGQLLALGHGCEQDLTQARRWLLRSKAKQSDVDVVIEKSALVVEFETAQKLPICGLTCTERLERYAMSLVPSEEKKSLNDYYNLFKDSNKKHHPSSFKKETCLHFQAANQVMAIKALQGSKTAQKYFVGLDLLNQAKSALEMQNSSEAFRLYRQADRVWHPLPVDLETRKKLCDAATKAFQRNSKDADALYVIVHYNAAMSLSSLSELIRMAQQCTILDPCVAEYHYLLGHFHAFNNDYTASYRSIERALELEWEPEWLYSKASSLRLMDDSDRDDVIKAFEEYLSLAEPDSSNLPKALYSMAECYSFSDVAKARECFEKAQRAESPDVRLPVLESLDDYPPKRLLQVILNDPKWASRLSDSNPSDKSHCGNCGKPEPPRRCSKCKAVFYCNRDCQLKHWKNHKKLCRF